MNIRVKTVDNHQYTISMKLELNENDFEDIPTNLLGASGYLYMFLIL
ncbi:hypothetical protein [Clostridium sp.]